MIQITRIFFLMTLILVNAEFLLAHQNHYNKKAENLVTSSVSASQIKPHINGDNTLDYNCNSNDLTGIDCFCCVNGICFTMSCDTNKMKNESSCKKQCENEKSNDSNLIDQSIKTQHSYKIFFLNYVPSTKDLITNNHQIQQKIITTNTPTYISIQSFLI